MLVGKQLLARMALLIIVALLLCAASCGRGRLQAAHSSGEQPIGGLETVAPDVLAELDALACPEGVDSALWAELKAALEAALLSQQESRLSSRDSELKESRLENRDSFSDMARSASTPPTGEANRVNDLAIADNGDGTFALSWHYRNLGDYDQDGKVGISDITPIAMHYGETYDPEAEPNCIQAVIDGSGNGKVDIADVTQIAMYFSVSFHHYAVEGTDDYEQPYTEVAQAALPAHDNIARLELTHDLGVPPYQYWRVAPVDAEGVRGQPSNVVSTVVGEPPEIISVSPTEGDSGTETTFSAEVTGDGPFEYYWDLGGGASPNQSTAPAPTVTLSRGGTLPEPIRSYPATLTVSNPYGTDVLDFDLSVSAWWHVEELPQYESPEYFVSIGCSAIDADGTLWITLDLDETPEDPGGRSLRVAYLHGNTWETALILDQPPADDASLAIDSQGNPAISYRKGSSLTRALHFIRREDSVWTDYFVDSGGINLKSRLFFDSQDRAVIAYSYYGTPPKVARETPDGWDVIDHPLGEGASRTAATVDQDDKIVLAASYADGQELRLVRETEGGWENELIAVVQGDGSMNPHGIAIDSGNRAEVLYFGGTEIPLTIAREQAGGGFAISPVEGYIEDYYTMTFAISKEGLETILVVPQDLAGEPVQLGYYDGSTWQWSSVFYISDWAYYPTLMFSEDDVPIVHWSQLLGSYW